MVTGTSPTGVASSTICAWICGHFSPSPSICIPPWADDESLRRVPPGVAVPVCHQPLLRVATWYHSSPSALLPRATSTNCSTISGTGSSSIGKETKVLMICSTVCRWTRSCGLTPARRSGQEPPSSGTLSSSRPWYRVSGSWDGSYYGTRPCNSSRTPPRSWPSSVPLGRSGAETWPGASAAEAARGASAPATDAHVAAVRLPQWRHQHATSQQLSSTKGHTQKRTHKPG